MNRTTAKRLFIGLAACFFVISTILTFGCAGTKIKAKYETKDNSIASEIPLVVLVNNGSASASEITAGALQDTGRATLVGTQTFGKGLIQNWIPLQQENGAIRITIARWLTPNGKQIQGDGLTPDYVSELTEEDIDQANDRQLQKAIDVLSN